ncbi:MAG: 50S ribosomal protein L31 [Desulfotomaculum sp.]|nr:50S ribosomal protein L31 [Desulfotomaculum sp.]MCL0081531.1 50S ribosomal protein L31 [Peptococcaceae bacterium]
MKANIHPAFQDAKVTCVCGSSTIIGSTKKELRLDICSTCHPFYTGTQRTIDTGGRADKFRKKYGLKRQ